MIDLDYFGFAVAVFVVASLGPAAIALADLIGLIRQMRK